MGNIHLVTGFAGREHVTSDDMGALNASLVGSGQYVLGKGNRFAASVITNNQIRVLDGDIIMQGRHIRLNEGGYVELTIENGTQGLLRNDLVVARYTKDSETGVEDCNLVVIKGEAVASNPVDPECAVGDILNGTALTNDMPLYRIPLNGINVQAPVALFVTLDDTLKSLSESLKAIDNNAIGNEIWLVPFTYPEYSSFGTPDSQYSAQQTLTFDLPEKIDCSKYHYELVVDIYTVSKYSAADASIICGEVGLVKEGSNSTVYFTNFNPTEKVPSSGAYGHIDFPHRFTATMLHYGSESAMYGETCGYEGGTYKDCSSFVKNGTALGSGVYDRVKLRLQTGTSSAVKPVETFGIRMRYHATAKRG